MEEIIQIPKNKLLELKKSMDQYKEEIKKIRLDIAQ